MLVAEKRKRMGVANKIGHDEYLYRLNGDPSQLVGAAARGGGSGYGEQYAAHQYGGQSDNYLQGLGGMGMGGVGPTPIIPSLAPPDSLPPILPSIHYPKPPVCLHGKSSGTGYLSGYPRTMQSAPLLSSNSMYVMAPSNTGISSSLPYAALPPVRSRTPHAQPMNYATQQYQQQQSSYYQEPSQSNYRFAGSEAGGRSSGMSGVLNWNAVNPVNSGASSRPPSAYTAQPRPFVSLSPGYTYDPSDLPPAGKATNRHAMPSYFAPSDVPTPSTNPRYRGTSQGLLFQTSNYTDIHR